MDASAKTYHFEKAPTLSENNKEWSSASASWPSVVGCAACLSDDIVPFATIRYVRYARCKECGFTFASPRPPENVLSDFYNSAFYNNYRLCERERLRIDPYFSISTSSISMLADWIKDHKAASVLDFGCGPGSFLAYLRDKHGFTDLDGIELNKESAAVAKAAHGLIIATDLSKRQKECYDIIVLIEVIEHVSDVDEFMRLVGQLLSPGGRLLVTTDAINNLASRYFPSWAVHFTGPSHISLFSERALSQLLDRFGYEIERKRSIPCNQIFGDFVFSPLYSIDFASPLSMTDLDDRLFVPGAAGRLMGLRPTRRPPAFFRVFRKLDSIAGRALDRIFPHRFSSHQFVLARKVRPPLS